MLNSDAEKAGMAGGLAGPAPVCVAADPKGILNSIADQIAAADERHTEALVQMQRRLDHFGADAAHLTAAASPQAAPAYNRVEQRIQDLAARLASGLPRDGADHAHAGYEHDAGKSPAAPPAALLSAAGPGAATFAHRQAPVADTFDVIGDATQDGVDESWDRHAAEALTRIYEGVDEPATPSHEQHARIELGATTAAEDRFALIANRIEHYVQQLRPLEAFTDLDERFERLEQRLDSVISQGHGQQSTESLAALEVQIEEITRHVEAAQQHYSRLDVIENELRQLAGNVAEERLAEVVRRNVGPPPAMDDVATLVADHVASLLNARDQHPGQNGADLQALIQSFVEEQRHGSEQTATMLDTMQEAMIRLLDRMDAMENAQYTTASVGVTTTRVDTFTQDSAADRHDDGADPARVQAAIEQARGTPLHIDAPEPHHEPELQPEAAAHEPAAAHARAVPPRMYVGQQPAPPAAPEAPPVQPKAPTNDAAATVARTRSELMASARRAREGAPGALEIDPGRPASEGGERPKPDGKRRKAMRLSPLTISLVALVALGAGFTAVSTLTRAPQTQPQSSSAPVSAPAAVPPAAMPNAPAVPTAPAAPQQRSDAESTTDQQLPVVPVSTGAPAEQAGQAQQGRIEMPPLAVGPNSLRIAATQGDASAQFEVASRLAEGNGLPQNLSEALVWYERAAAQGFVLAQYRLGTHYERGLGVKPDLGRAAAWYQRAAEQGNVKAMHNLAVLSASRDAAHPDYASAAKWFSAAAAYGLTDSQYNLAVLFDSGLGVGRDLRAAYKWFSIAAASGDTEAAKRRDAMKPRLEPRTLADVDGEVASWRPLPIDPMANDARAAGEQWKRRSTDTASAQ